MTEKVRTGKLERAKPRRALASASRVPPVRFSKERFFQALGDGTRLRLLNLMRDEELCVCNFVEVLAQPQPKISRHLAYLHRAGIVEVRRDGRWMHYRIAPPSDSGAAKLLRRTLKWLQRDRTMQADRARLARAACVSAESTARPTSHALLARKTR